MNSNNKNSGDDDDEEPLFVPRQDNTDSDFEDKSSFSSNKQLIELLANAQHREAQLHALLAQEQRTRPLARHVHPYDVERVYMRRQPWWWFAMLVLSVICVFGAYSKGRLVSTVVNVVAHKLIWRRLYVQTAPSAMLFAALVIAYTFYFV